ncbi:MAG: metallophosphoesterase [Fuerstiella sp.]
MPIHITNFSRRAFLKTSLGAGASLLTFEPLQGDQSPDTPEHVALLADTHIDADPTKVVRGSVMASNLLNVVADVLAQPQQPSLAIIDGDCAFNVGLPADYQTLSSLVTAFPAAQIPLHMALGNHDDRPAFLKQFATDHTDASTVEGKHVSLLKTRHVNWFLTDTLQKVNHVTGEVGAQQRDWLKAALADNRDKPAIVVGHHNPQFNVPENGRVTGLQDTQPLFDLLESFAHVKAYVYGHTHSWNTQQRDSGLHLINLPPVGYVFNETSPIGWVDAAVTADRMQLTLRCIDPGHPDHLTTKTLAWQL